MEEYHKSVVPIIESNYENLTNVEKTIADFFITNKKQMDFSSKSISNFLFVSEASLSRFAKKLGFIGYREFVYRYQDAFMEKEVITEEYMKEVLNTYQELLNKTYNLINSQQIRNVTKRIAKKKRVFIYGMGSSGLAAREFEMRFIRIGVDVEAITDSHLLMLNSGRITKDCLVIGISISGKTKEVISAMGEAAKKGADVILITSTNNSVYSSMFDEVLLMSVKGNLEYGNVISPQFPVLIIIDIIYADFIEEDRKNRTTIYDSTLNVILERKL